MCYRSQTEFLCGDNLEGEKDGYELGHASLDFSHFQLSDSQIRFLPENGRGVRCETRRIVIEFWHYRNRKLCIIKKRKKSEKVKTSKGKNLNL